MAWSIDVFITRKCNNMNAVDLEQYKDLLICNTDYAMDFEIKLDWT